MKFQCLKGTTVKQLHKNMTADNTWKGNKRLAKCFKRPQSRKNEKNNCRTHTCAWIAVYNID